jgi:ribulose 1,5-bisphosphate carboxylase large subunit-like protein
MRQAWEAAMSDVALDEFAKTHAELRRALEKY